MKRGKVSTKVVKQEEVKAPTISSRTIVGNTTACPPLVIESKKIILLAYGAIIKSVCIQTGNLLTTYTGHQDIVTHIAKYEASGNELLITSTSIDGVVNVWNQTTLETVTSSNVGIPILKVLLLPRIKENNEVVEEKDSIVIKPTAAVNDAYFLTHPEKNNKDPLNQTFTVQIHNSTDFQTLEASPTIITTSTIFESFRFSLKSEISLDYSSSTMETAIITVENKNLVFHILSKHLFAQKTKKIDIGLEITALACHPATGVIAVGTQYGEIFLFRNVSDYLRAWYQSPNKKDKEFDGILIKSKLTWHSHAVKSLAFSVDGRILYSGGEESVLTIWNLNKSLKSFIPRVGAPISSIVSFQDASQATKILLSSADNGLKLINTVNVEVEWSWQALFVAQTLPQKLSSSSGSEDSLKQRSRQILLQHYLYPYASFDQQSDKHWKPVLEVDPSQARHITVAGNLGALQWLDTNAAVVSKKLNVLNYIRVSRKDSPKNHFIPTVIHHKFTQDGRILVTVDMKKNEEILTEYSLKFWLLEDETEGENSNGHELIAQMNSPHQDLPITALAVASLGHVSNFSLIAVAATASLDGSVKVWKGAYETIKAMTKAKEANGNTPLIDVKTNKFIWNCAYSFQYRSSPCLALAWSSDLSLLSVAHDNIVSFWNPHTVTMKHAITDDLRIKIRYLAVIEPRSLPQFGRGCGQAFLLVGSVSVIRVYDLMTMTLLWSYSARYINAVAVAKDEREIWKSEEKSGDDDSSIFKKEGWIALSISSNKLHTEDNEDIPAPKQKSEKDEESSTKRKSPVNEVLIFSPISSTPLVQYTTPSKIASLSFLANPDSQSTDLIALTLDSEVIAISSSTTTSSESTKQIQVARVKQAKLPVIIQETKLEDDGVVIISAEEKKKQLNHKLLVPAANSRLTNKNWLKELIPENNQDLPKPSDITLDFLKAISSQRDPSTSTSAPSSSIISSSTLTNSSSSAHLIESQKDALHSSSAAKKSSVKRKIDIDQITSILEKKIPLLAKRSFSQLNDDEEENHTEDHGHDSNGVAQAEVETNGKSKSKAKSSSKKVASDEPTFASPPPKEQLPPTTPAAIVPPTPETENRRKTRRMTRSESDLSEANVPQALLANVEQNLPPVTPSKSKASSSAIVATPSKTVTTAPYSATKESSKKAEVVVESETRVTRSRQRKNSESESESEVEKELPAEPRTARASRRRPETLATIPEEKVVAEDVKEETEEVVDETKGPRRSTRKRGKSDLEETENEEKDEKQDTKSKRRNTKK